MSQWGHAKDKAVQRKRPEGAAKKEEDERERARLHRLTKLKKKGKKTLPKSEPLRPLDEAGFEWPSLFYIKVAQSQDAVPNFATFDATMDLWTVKSAGKDVMWTSALERRLFIVARALRTDEPP
ncbi:hypothetical protein SDRG_04011 [Saprolegnia diclina VS20]|uniref:Uncharacterized protein n=1 Tax=Saprolegnia diclina (strain VS20) TaxID=1156394 RepID=T0QW66_SAPDV|nr:hypothetical protein SDRG_04011 [Saprolegnia diclina VS20]EQC38290.1 hypothetical protein SDRG_04011 [Saprolegnia diclina VS20]|eukprot:XP_008607882.1 hypothetical protein SDRG_04011 [Saprolegnia diclina VS20]